MPSFLQALRNEMDKAFPSIHSDDGELTDSQESVAEVSLVAYFSSSSFSVLERRVGYYRMHC